MVDQINSKSSKSSYLTLEFLWGDLAADPQYLRMTNWSSDVNHLGQIYKSEPRIAVKLPTYLGSLTVQACEIDTPFDTTGGLDVDADLQSLLNRITAAVHSPVFVVIGESTISRDSNEVQHRIMFKGRVASVTKYPSGRRGTARLIIQNFKGLLTGNIAFASSHQCQWHFGGKGCLYPKLTVPFRIDDIFQRTITGVKVASGTAPEANQFNRGFISLDGLSIMIREVTNGDCQMLWTPPPYWLDTENPIEAEITQGCAKTLEACQFWGNESEFSGSGYAIPPYNPLLENPG